MDNLDTTPKQSGVSDRCRTCLLRIGTNVCYNIFEPNIQNTTVAEILHSFTTLTLDENYPTASLPKVVCHICYEKLNSLYEFITHIENVDKKLKEVLEKKVHLSFDNVSIIDSGFHEVCVEDSYIKNVKTEVIDEVSSENGTGSEVFVCSGDQVELLQPSTLKYETEPEYMCKICNKHFKSKGNYQRHSKMHTRNEVPEINKPKIEISINENDLICTNCEQSFNTKYQFSEHLEKCSSNFSLSDNSWSYNENSLEENKTESKHNDSIKVNGKKRNVTVKGNVKKKRLAATEIGDFTCNICKSGFQSKLSLLSHMTKHPEVNKLPCNVYGIQLRKLSNLKDPQISLHGNTKELSINIQSDEKKTKYSQPAEEEVLVCEICKTKFRNKYSMSAHMRIHVSKGRILSCTVCGKVFRKLSHLKRHQLTHEARGHKCTMCKKSFNNKDLLEEHMKQHNAKSHKCPVCEKSFSNIPSLNMHIKTHTRNQLYLCSYCGKRFDSNTNLKQHYQRHSGVRAFACPLCPSKFVTKGELKAHSSTHTGEKPHHCQQCSATFTKHSSLVKHNLRHQGVKPYSCDTCFKKFFSNSSLKCHYRIHTGEKPYSCDICARAFTQSNDLVKHRRRHLGEKIFKCDQCTESFRLQTELKHHIAQHFVSQRDGGQGTEEKSEKT